MFTDPTFLWALAGLLLIGAEFLIPGLVIIFFGFGALATSLFTGILPNLDARYGLQALIWIASSGISFGLLRRTLKRVFHGRLLPSSDAPDAGEVAVVVERITPETPGRIRYQGTTWKAVSYTETIEAGEKVEILERENLTYVVTKSMI